MSGRGTPEAVREDYLKAVAAGLMEGPTTDERIVVVFVPGKLWTVNSERSQHYMKHRKQTNEWREAAGWAGMQARLPRLQSATIRVVPFQPRGVLADAGAHLPPTKASIDGLVDIGVLPDDDPEHVTALTLCAPRRVPEQVEDEGLMLVLTGPPLRS